MPSKYIIKDYVENGIYHVYNRGVEKRDIFMDDHDYKFFLYLLKSYLLPVSSQSQKGSHPEKGETLRRGELRLSFSDEIELLSYCLMPNHFHLLIRQKEKDSMSRFMKSLGTNYSMYFNYKYDRVGKLFQGAFKAILVTEDDYLLHLTRYIHLNPASAKGSHPEKGETLQEGQTLEDWYSSYGEYIGRREARWVKPQLILDILNQERALSGAEAKVYKDFVLDYQNESELILGKLTLE